jgi:glutathione-regulated potassium-efflux system ancillary protein KefF
MLALVYAHPYPNRSRANRVLVDAVRDLPGLELRSLYDLYPDFDIDVEAEQEVLERASGVVWQHPLHWYSVPSLLKHWFDKVLARGWAYGEGGTALHGKRCLWVTTTGGDDLAFHQQGMHGSPFASFVPPVEQTARFCGMRWEEPLVIHGAHQVPRHALFDAARSYRARLVALYGPENEADRD